MSGMSMSRPSLSVTMTLPFTFTLEMSLRGIPRKSVSKSARESVATPHRPASTDGERPAADADAAMQVARQLLERHGFLVVAEAETGIGGIERAQLTRVRPIEEGNDHRQARRRDGLDQ